MTAAQPAATPPPAAQAPATTVDVDVVLLGLAPAEDAPPAEVDAEEENEGGASLQVWLTRDGDLQRLPGRRLSAEEDLDDAARRVLARIGVPEPRHLEQLASFGAPHRLPGRHAVSVSYLALVPVPHRGGGDIPGAWVDVADAGPLAWDHDAILDAAVHRIRSKLSYSTIAYGLLPDEFTMSELQGVYEAVLGTTLDKRNFRRKVGNLGLLADTGRVRRGAHRPARLHTFATPSLVLLDDVIAPSHH